MLDRTRRTVTDDHVVVALLANHELVHARKDTCQQSPCIMRFSAIQAADHAPNGLRMGGRHAGRVACPLRCTAHSPVGSGLAPGNALTQSIFEHRRPEKEGRERHPSASAVKRVKKIETKNENVT